MSKLEEWEINKYWEIFSGLDPVGGLLSGDKVAPVLKNSQLPESQLEKIWELSDIDGDGNLDFEEFCIAMRLIFDIINGNMSQIPEKLPEWLVPANKTHLITANAALRGDNSTTIGGQFGGGRRNDDDDDDLGLSTDFNWYISPQDRQNYTAVYSANADYHGLISFDSLTELYSTLDIPETDLRSAWNLVNPRSEEKIDREQAIVFLHILNNRSKGVRVPRSVPASLRATFEKSKPEYSLNSNQSVIRRDHGSDHPSGGRDSSTSKKSAFAEGYLSRLGLGGRSSFNQKSGTDFSSTKDTDWEEVRLKRQLADLESLITDAEAAAERRKKGISDYGTSKSALVKRELEQLLDYKEKQLQRLRAGGSANGSGHDLSGFKEEIDLITEQVSSLKEFQATKDKELAELRAQLV